MQWFAAKLVILAGTKYIVGLYILGFNMNQEQAYKTAYKEATLLVTSISDRHALTGASK